MSRPRTVLCVDDNAALRDNLREILEDAGYEVREAASCAEAEARAAEEFAVALVDVRLPDGDGTALARRLRELQTDAQVIMLTGFATVESAVSAVRAGAWAYLMKPCATPDLLVTVGQAVRQIELLEDKRELQQRALMAEKLAAVGTLTAGLSHEIKNPLNAAALQLAVLERRVTRLPAQEQPALVEPLKLVQHEVARLNAILEDFLQFARPRELQLAPVDAAVMLQHIADLLAAQAERASVRIERRWSAALPLQADPGRLQQAVMNLVLNAIQATPGGGAVRIEAAVSDGHVQIAVEDSGPGIPDELRRRVFEPFFTTKPGGSGLGLPIVHSVVEQHGGAVSVERGRLGGARFLVRLPSAASLAPPK
jgi:signal transduction histidine kinase